MPNASPSHGLVRLGLVVACVGAAGCSGSTGRSCSPLYVGSAGAISGTLVSPVGGATGVPATALTLVLSELTGYTIVLQATTGGASGQISTTPVAVPSPYPTREPTSTNGDYAVSVPALQAGTTYAVGTDRLVDTCGGTQFTPFGTFTTQ